MKPLGIMFCFFAIIAVVAAIADLNTGKYNLADPAQLLRGSFWILPGILLFAIGIRLIRIDPLTAPRR